MHRHRMAAQIMLVISILSSVLAAPAISVREMQEARRALAVRVPAEGVAAVHVWQKREPPAPGEIYHDALPNLEQPNPQNPEAQSTRPSVPPGKEEVYHDASSKPLPSNTKSPKIMTPEKIKATKYVGLVGLLTTAYMTLLIPEILHNGKQDGKS